MTRHRDQAHLRDILRAAQLIDQFAAQTSLEEFKQDEMVTSAVMHQFLVLGEATKRLSIELRHAYPDVPWRQMAGMRDTLIHEYDTIDLELVWRTATRNVPDLIEILGQLIET